MACRLFDDKPLYKPMMTFFKANVHHNGLINRVNIYWYFQSSYMAHRSDEKRVGILILINTIEIALWGVIAKQIIAMTRRYQFNMHIMITGQRQNALFCLIDEIITSFHVRIISLLESSVYECKTTTLVRGEQLRLRLANQTLNFKETASIKCDHRCMYAKMKRSSCRHTMKWKCYINYVWSLTAPNVVTTFGAAIEENGVKMTIFQFQFQCIYRRQCWHHTVASLGS